MATPDLQPTVTANPDSPVLQKNLRILVVDDNEAIHDDFRKILSANAGEAEFDAEEAALFGGTASSLPRVGFELSFASQGAQALEMVQEAWDTGRRFAMVFMDVRMPPGWDGLETTVKVWDVDPDLQVVICTAYSDKSWDQMVENVAHPERLLILKKPFDSIEVLQLAHALTEKWLLVQSSRINLEELEVTVAERTRELQAANDLLEFEVDSHKATCNALRGSEQEIAEFFDNASVGLHQINAEGTIIRVNKTELDLLGYKREEYVGHHISEFHADAEAVGRLLKRLLAGDTVQDFEARLRCKDGTIKHVLIDSNALWENGEFIHTRSFTRDVTERKQAETKLRESEANMAAAQRIAHFGSWEVDLHSHGTADAEANSLRWSDETYRIFGYEPGGVAVTNALFYGAVPVEDHEGINQIVGEAIAAKTSCSYVHRIRRPDGEERIVHETAQYFEGETGGRSPRLVGTVHDITERTRLEAQLFQSQKLETVGKLAGGIAHEFNSIMTAIIGQSELLLNELPAGSRPSRSATEIRKAADRAATLTRQLLAYGRKQLLLPEILDLNHVIARMESMLRHLMSSSVDVRITPDAGLCAVKADAGQIEQVIMNMAMNAHDAMPSGGRLMLETSNITIDENTPGPDPELKPGTYAVLAISDSGTGMKPEVKARAFEPFFSTKDVGEGRGLGLATCHGIIKQSGGHISVSSELGHGTTFKIYLPQAPQAVQAAVMPSAPSDMPPGSETILLVEDDPALREMAAQLLVRLGYRVLTATSVTSALSLMEQPGKQTIDLLFTDLAMPQLEGKEWSDRMRVQHPHTKCLFTSSYTEHTTTQQPAGSNGVALLQKPFTPSSLVCKIREVLDA